MSETCHFVTSVSVTGFVHFFRPKIQGLFKDFPGPYLEISRTLFKDNFTSKPRKMFLLTPMIVFLAFSLPWRFFMYSLCFVSHMTCHGWLSHYIKVDSLIASKTKCFVWILVIFSKPGLIGIFSQPFFIKMTPSFHCDILIQLNSK